MTIAFDEWRRHVRSEELTQQKNDAWLLKAPDRKLQLEKDVQIEEKRESWRTLVVEANIAQKKATTTLQMMRLQGKSDKEKTKLEEIKLKQIQEQSAEAEKQRIADAAKLDTEIQGRSNNDTHQ